MLLYISYWTLWLTLHCDLQLSLRISFPVQSLTWWFHLFWFVFIDKKNIKRSREKGYRNQLRNFKHKGKHKIGWYPKSLLIFTSYQVQGWWTMIMSPVKAKPDGSNVTEILLNSSWKTRLKYSKAYIFILQKVKTPSDGFCTHLFFVSEIILIFGDFLTVGYPGY